MAVGAREAGGVKRRHQRRALSAGGDVAAAQIGDHADAGAFGEQCGVEQLHGEAAFGTMP